ncbi:DNA (cytosine-5-)-methyltransferase [Mesorhizobium sp. CAU 1732]|uniref:DNA cytosine methyltransferase n=1 Tax=Mesorhizobium sp. CAU 1732 TaxID=3140358 RepID=UPI00326150FB
MDRQGEIKAVVEEPLTDVAAERAEQTAEIADNRDDAGAGDDVAAPPFDRDFEALYGRELVKLKKSVATWRARQAREAFRIGDLWKSLEETLPRASIAAFLANECQVPRQDVARYAKLVSVLGQQREILIDSGVAVTVMLELAQQNEIVRREAFSMICSGRSLQTKELRALKRDIGLAESVRSESPDQSRERAFKAFAAKKARHAASNWLRDLEGVINELLELSIIDPHEDRSESTVARAEQLCEKARDLHRRMPDHLDANLLATSETPRLNVERAGWPRVLVALQRIGERDLFPDVDWDWPKSAPLKIDQLLIWDLAWAFGHDRDNDPRASRRRLRLSGRLPLDTAGDHDLATPELEQTVSVLEICAGAGGQALGLHAAGFAHAGLVEIDRDAAATLRQNKPLWNVVQADLRELDLAAYKGIDLLAGGVPCQPFSASGERMGRHDARDLFPQALELVRQLRPKAVMLENVTGALQSTNSMYRLEILAEMAAMGYDAEWRTLYGPEFGLCQKRERAVLVGFRPGIMHRFRWPTPLRTAAPTVGEVLKDLMGANGWKHVDAWAAKANGYAPTLIGGSQKKKGIDLAQKKSRKSWTDLGVDPGGLAKSVPDKNSPAGMRPKLTLRMMARVQDFPDVWQFCGSKQQQFRQIANAFPPRMARAMGLAIMRALTGSEVDLERALASPIPTGRGLDLKRLSHSD